MPVRILLFAILLLSALTQAAGCAESSPNEPTPACTYSLSATTATVGASGGTGSVSVMTQASCSWTAMSATAWLTVTGGATGTGPGAVSFAAAANAGSEPRNGTLTVAGQAVVVTQGAVPPCTFTVLPTRVSFDERGGTGQVTVQTGGACSWTAASADGWLEITGGAEGSGDGLVTFVVAANTTADPRSGGLTVAGHEVAVEQAPDLQQCVYSVAPVTFDVCMHVPGAVASVIGTTASCPWTVSAAAPWLRVVGALEGIGPGAVSVEVADNYNAPRTGVVMVRWPAPTDGQNLHVVQAGCSYGVSRNEIVFTAGGGAGSFDVFQQSNPIVCGGPLQDQCIWAAETEDPWIAITSSMPRKGDDRVQFMVGANPGGPRIGTIVVRDRAVRIIQGG